eukprot:m.50363 g.50363  ORF g.50363 m.50363 type:complete len:50 (+) comp13412_c0_seq11:272-421(+)
MKRKVEGQVSELQRAQAKGDADSLQCQKKREAKGLHTSENRWDEDGHQH